MSLLPKIPGYEINSQLGRGGMGVVYLARQKSSKSDFAIKMLLGGRSASHEELARFRIEAAAHSLVDHPGIAKIHEIGVICGCPYFAMDYASNGCLKDYMARNPSTNIEWKLKTIKLAADALSHAHRRRILHRDLKPANILISSDGSPWVSDFGLVKFSAPMAAVSASLAALRSNVPESDPHLFQMATENKRLLPVEDADNFLPTLVSKCAERSGLTTESFSLGDVRSFVNRCTETRKFSGEISRLYHDMTLEGTVMGSPQFMSPEQAEGRIELIGPHTDVYGLGATLYHVLTGRPPVSGADSIETIRNVSNQVPIPPSLINSTVTDDLSMVVLKAIDKDPGGRYENMEMFSDDLERILVGRAPLAKLHARTATQEGDRKSFFQRFTGTLSTILTPRQNSDVDQSDLK